MFAVCCLLTAIFGSGGGLVSTTLTAPVSITETGEIDVVSTTGYRTEDTIYIEDEMIHYTAKTATTLLNLSRAYNHTTIAAHTAIGTPVYTQEMGTMNQASGASIAQTETTGGTGTAAGFNPGFFVRALPQVVLWNFPFLQGQLIYLRIILQMVGVGLTVTVIFGGINTFMSIFKR